MSAGPVKGENLPDPLETFERSTPAMPRSHESFGRKDQFEPGLTNIITNVKQAVFKEDFRRSIHEETSFEIAGLHSTSPTHATLETNLCCARSSLISINFRVGLPDGADGGRTANMPPSKLSPTGP